MTAMKQKPRGTLSARRLTLLGSAAAVGAALVFGGVGPGQFTSRAFAATTQTQAQGPAGFADLIAKVKPAVISVRVKNVGWDQLMFFTQTTPEFWDKIIKINYVGVLNCTKCALDIMIPKGAGAIVSISSDASRSGEPREAVYGGVKAAVNSFMKTIAKENGRYGIRCNVVCPGVTVPVDTEEVGTNSMWTKPDSMFTAEQFEKVAKALPLRKLGRPNDIANAVVFLSSAAAGHVTGQVLSVSGGYTMIG